MILIHFKSIVILDTLLTLLKTSASPKFEAKDTCCQKTQNTCTIIQPTSHTVCIKSKIVMSVEAFSSKISCGLLSVNVSQSCINNLWYWYTRYVSVILILQQKCIMYSLILPALPIKPVYYEWNSTWPDSLLRSRCDREHCRKLYHAMYVLQTEK